VEPASIAVLGTDPRAPSPFLGPDKRSRDFAWCKPGGPFRALTSAQVEAYDRDGFFVLENVFDEKVIEEVIEAIDPWETRIAMSRDEPAMHFMLNLVTRSETCRALTLRKVFQDISFDLLGPNVRLFWDQAVYKAAGAETWFPWHQDTGYAFARPEHYVTCWLALSEATLENGCPWLARGIHRRGPLEHRETPYGVTCVEIADLDFESVPGATPITLRPGSLAVFSSLTPHATGPNRSSGTRKAFIIQYARDGSEVLVDDYRKRCDGAAWQYRILIDGASAASS
jgi:phytanoyl-CoA hydroxylase